MGGGEHRLGGNRSKSQIFAYTLSSAPPVVKGADGKYPAPLPGQYDPFQPVDEA